MPDTPLPSALPDLRLEPRRPRRPARPDRLPASLWISGGLHVAALIALLFLHRVPPPLPLPEPSFDVMFEGAPTPQKGVPVPDKFTETPEGETSPRPVPTPPNPSPPPSPEAEPRVNVIPPEYLPYMQPQPQAEAEPPRQPNPARQRSTRQAQRNNPFAHPMRLSFGPAAPARERRGLQGSRSLDLAMGPVIQGGRIMDSVAHVASPGASSDYIEGISEYVERNKFYPREAAENGEEGTSVLAVTIARNGQVRDVKLVESAGSNWLDMAWISLFRNHRFAPFPDDMPEKERTFTLSMDFEILYGHGGFSGQ